MLKYFKVKPGMCGIKGCLNQVSCLSLVLQIYTTQYHCNWHLRACFFPLIPILFQVFRFTNFFVELSVMSTLICICLKEIHCNTILTIHSKQLEWRWLVSQGCLVWQPLALWRNFYWKCIYFKIINMYMSYYSQYFYLFILHIIGHL